jgi:mannose-6-phosphate isomerase-like protein (cupin superfamily)
MYVIDQVRPAETPIPGVRHATWASSREGLKTMSLWRQSIAAGGATPPHSHDCEEVVMCLAGNGEVHLEGKVHRFGPEQTVMLPAGVLHQIFNVGTEPLELTAVFSATPVGVTLPDGSTLELPWHS